MQSSSDKSNHTTVKKIWLEAKFNFCKAAKSVLLKSGPQEQLLVIVSSTYPRFTVYIISFLFWNFMLS